LNLGVQGGSPCIDIAEDVGSSEQDELVDIKEEEFPPDGATLPQGTEARPAEVALDS
jgi:hypothetical protein